MLGALGSLWLRAARIGRGALNQAGEAFRLLAFVLLRAAVALWPRAWALALADAFGRLLAASPFGASVRQSMRAAFPISSANASKLAREWIGRPFRDFVIASRVVANRERPDEWLVHTHGALPFLNDPNQSFIIATGHFSREAMTVLYLPSVLPRKLATVVAPLDRQAMSPSGLRLRLQLGEIITGIRRLRGPDVDIVEVGGPSVVTRLLRHLRVPGNVVIIATDAAWPKGKPGGFERAFAGHAAHSYALGTARLSRLSQCPIITFLPFVDDAGAIVIEWGEPIPPPARDDHFADERVTNAILDTFERAIGLRPGQYVLPIGNDRRWNPTTQQWAPHPARSPLAAPTTQAAAPAYD